MAGIKLEFWSMPSLHDKAHDGVLCSFSTRTSATAAWFQWFDRSSPPSSSRTGQADRSREGGMDPITTQISPGWVTLLQPARSHSNTLQNIYHGNHMPEPALTLCQSRLYPPVRDLGFGLVWFQPDIPLNHKRAAKEWSAQFTPPKNYTQKCCSFRSNGFYRKRRNGGKLRGSGRKSRL